MKLMRSVIAKLEVVSRHFGSRSRKTSGCGAPSNPRSLAIPASVNTKRRPVLKLPLTILLAAIAGTALADDAGNQRLAVFPQEIKLHGKSSRQQLIVSRGIDGRNIDLTRKSTFQSLTPNIVAVDANGLVSPVSDGTGKLSVRANGQTAEVVVKIERSGNAESVDFQRDIIPIFSRAACNAGACHGKARGQNGFQLSLLGFDAQFDFDALAKEARGRRVFTPEPERSLLLLKPTGRLPHGGGKRMEFGGSEYETLRRWIVAGMPRRQPETPGLVKLSVTPTQRIMSREEQQQLIVTAHYADSSTRDVTRLTAFQSNESPIADVDEHGRVTAGMITGEAAIMARYMGQFAVCNVAVPLAGQVPEDLYAKLPRYNFIDEHVWNKLQRLRITPSQPAPDHKFLRRAFIDVIGRIPTTDEARGFLNDKSAAKREKLIDYLLEQPEFADHWANKWADLLRPNPYRVGIKAVLNYDAWIRDSFRKNKPYDQFVRELLTAQGSTFHNGAVTMFRDRRSPDEVTTIVSQLFLGIRLECAKCHHHPFEVWGQDDFYSFAAYFSRIARKGGGVSPPISGTEEVFFVSTSGSVKHPITGEVLEPRPLFGKAPEIEKESDPRQAIAEWITSGENPFFNQVMVNRVWADVMGRGLVEPVDDLRATNPATNQPLLKALGEDFRDQGYNLKKLIRRITTSYAYGLSSIPGDRNVVDTRNYSRHYRQRLRAEVMLDSVVQITGIPEKFDAMPPGSRAKEIWTHRVGSLFLDAFGRPDPNQDPPCERTGDTTIVQSLHLMNSQNLYNKVTSNSGRAAKLAQSKMTPQQIVEELYLSVYARFPDQEEKKVVLTVFEKNKENRRHATEDILWALLNTPEFVFKD